MNEPWIFSLVVVGLVAQVSAGGETGETAALEIWQQRVVDHARIMSQAKWKPVAGGIPIRGEGEFKANSGYTGVPYSNGGWDGRLIGFDIHLRTFLAAVQNPRSLLYTTDLRGQRSNSAAFYGMVCSVFTSYALQLAVPVSSGFHGPPHRKGIVPTHPQSAQGARVGDVLWNKGHVAIVTHITTAADGTISHVRVEESRSPTARTQNYTAKDFDKYLAQRKGTLYRITDHDAWRGQNCAERFLFPNYAMDTNIPTINRVLLLDLGDWVAYRKDQPVMFNIMDRDKQGVKALVIKRGEEQLEQIALGGTGIVERTFARSGDYTAHCIMKDGSSSRDCEFSVCKLESRPVTERVVLGKPWEIEVHTENMNAILVQIAEKHIWINDEQRRQGRVPVPADALSLAGKCSVLVTGENRYGRLRNRHVIDVVKPE